MTDPTITNGQPFTLSCEEAAATPPASSKRSSSSPSKKIPKIFSRLKKNKGNEKSSTNHIKQDSTVDEPSNIAVVPLVQGEIKENAERPAPEKHSEHKNPIDLADSDHSLG